MPVQPPEEITVANLVQPTPPVDPPAAPAPPLTPTQQRHQKLVEEYELPDSSYNPDQPSVPSVVAEPVPEPSQEPAAPSKPQHSKRVLRMAADFGIPQHEIDATEPEALEEALVILNRQVLEERKVFLNQRPQPTSAEQPAAAVTTPAEPVAPAEFTGGLTRDEMDELHPSLVKFVEAVKAELNDLRSLKQLVPQVQSMSQREQRREFESFQQRCDTFFAKHEDVFGKGNYAELKQGGPEHRRRQALLDAAGRDDPKIPFDRRAERARVDLDYKPFGQQAPATPAPTDAPAAPRQPTDAELITRDAQGRITGRISVEEWNASSTARPTHRETPKLPPGRERAIAAVAEHLKHHDVFGAEGPNGAPKVADIDTLPD